MTLKKEKKQKFCNLIISVGAILCMWLVWIIAWAVVDDGYVIPSFTETFSQFCLLIVSADFWAAFGMTLARSVYSWLISLAVAILIASVCTLFPAVRRFVSPFVTVFRTVPTMAVTLMLLIWSSPRVAPSIVAFLMIFPIAYNQLMAAFDDVDKRLIDMLKVYHVPFSKRLFKVYIPQILPPILSQIGANLSLTLKVIISAEVMCSTFNSLGGLINQANVFLNTAQMFALTISAVIVGGLLEWALSKLTLLTRRWTGASSGQNSRRTAESAENGVGKEGGVDRV